MSETVVTKTDNLLRKFTSASPQKRRASLGAAIFFCALCFLAAVFFAHRFAPQENRAAAQLDEFPPVILWAWARNEDLTFINPQKVGVAFLAETIEIDKENLTFAPRLQTLRVAPSTKLMAVVRIENARGGDTSMPLDEAHCNRIAVEIARLAARENVSAVQIDFDAVASQRDAYRAILRETRRLLPSSAPLSITALASWCMSDAWIEDLPIDEAVPMLFRIGTDRREIVARLAAGERFRAAKCRRRAGISTDEPNATFPPAQRIYIFHPRAWTAEAASSAVAAALNANKGKLYAD
jgi:hypothetical protein